MNKGRGVRMKKQFLKKLAEQTEELKEQGLLKRACHHISATSCD